MEESGFLTLHELVKKARQNLDQNSWDYIVGAAETETTARRNRLAIDGLAFRPRVLRDVSAVDASTEFLGRRLRLPLLLAPVGSLELFVPEGAAAAARAAQTFGVPHMLSSVCMPGLEEVAAAAPEAMRLYQLYVRGDGDWVEAVAARAEAAGNTAFCLTVDTAVYSRRERDIAKRNLRRVSVPGRDHQARLAWRDVERLRRKTKLPLILKGIATREDALLAVEHGVEIVYVSNHGGRQLDHGRGALEMLPEIVDAVGGRAKIIVDGGICRGTDLVKAVALGADLVGIGRMECIGLAAGGEAGLVRLLELLEHEVVASLALLGVTRWSELDRSYLHPATPVEPPRTLGAFPLLDLSESSFY
jgi:isopentenyl diphosphate isomerase/L-lactate dehydrogenase-like FMN-dependent dehydrogenase